MFLAKELQIAVDDFENQIKKPIKMFPPPKEGQKSMRLYLGSSIQTSYSSECAFIQVKDRDIHTRLLREPFKHEGTSLNIKVSLYSSFWKGSFFPVLSVSHQTFKILDFVWDNLLINQINLAS